MTTMSNLNPSYIELELGLGFDKYYTSFCRLHHIIKQYPYDCTQTAAQADKTNRTGSSDGAV